VTGTGSFLPGDPIPNEDLENRLGRLDDAPRRVRKFVENIGPKMLESGGIDSRHLAIDPETHRLTHTISSLAEVAARRALEQAGKEPSDVELLLLSSPNYDQITPPTSTTLQELLGIEQCAEMEIHSNCSGVGKCVQIAYDSLRAGRYKTALVAYSQLSSMYLRSCYFNQQRMTKTQAALRYILADGAGAVFLEAVKDDAPGDRGHEVLGTYVESVGGKRAAGMTAGGGVMDLTDTGNQILGIFERGSHHLSQDFAAVNRDAGPLLCQGVASMLDSLGVDPATVDHFVYSIPTKQLFEDNAPQFADRFGAGPEQMKFRARRTGYCGGASILLHFDEMVRSGEIHPGQTVVLHSVESSKWMSAGFVVKW
jgi:3-oxoacyl-[acyl-carrier-protein] synthase-3